MGWTLMTILRGSVMMGESEITDWRFLGRASSPHAAPHKAAA
jgi:hypothetical protein